MSVLFVALPVAIALGGAAVAAFIWATRGGQFDDLETPRWRVLTEDSPRLTPGHRPGSLTPAAPSNLSSTVDSKV